MRNAFFICLILFFGFMSCKNRYTKEPKNEVLNSSVFSPALEKEILKMIEIKNHEMNKGGIKPDVCNVTILKDNNGGNCIAIIGLSTNIVQNMTKFIPPSDSPETQIDSNAGVIRYTFLGNELIGCYLLSDSCNMLVNEKELMLLKDPIPGYPDVLNPNPDLIYDAPMRVFKIINADSLQLIKSSFIPQE